MVKTRKEKYFCFVNMDFVERRTMSKRFTRRVSRSSTLPPSERSEHFDACSSKPGFKQNGVDRHRYFSESDHCGITRKVTRVKLPECYKKVAILGPGPNLLYTLDQVCVFINFVLMIYLIC